MPSSDYLETDLAIDHGHYHFEYSNIHNHRLALIRRVDLWHQIAYAA